MNILITGGTGFIGSMTASVCLDRGNTVSATIHRPDKQLRAGIYPVPINDIGPDTFWGDWLNGKECVIHTAARAHIMKDRAKDPVVEFRRINTDGTLNLARQAAQSGVCRFIFVSSIKVNGENTAEGGSFYADDLPSTNDPYGLSKLEAEIGLREIAASSGMEIVIIRPPMVYGPGVKGNFYTMMQWVDKRIPLPLGAIHNQRSMVALDNLVDLILACVEHPSAANQVFLASDGEDVSTTSLLRLIGEALDRPVWLLPLPQSLLEVCGRMMGMGTLVQRLCGSLQVDIEKTRKLLNWTPPVSVVQGLQQTAAYYINQKAEKA